MAVITTYPASVIASCAAPVSVDVHPAARMRAIQAPITGPAKGTRMPIIGFPAVSEDAGVVRPTREVKLADRVAFLIPSTTKQPATIGVLAGAIPGRPWRQPD